MKFTLEDNEHFSIRSYEAGIITIGSKQYDSNIIVQPSGVINPWQVDSIESLQYEALAPALYNGLEVLILGTGPKQKFPSMEIAAKLSQHRIGFEVMDTAAACRTYNILLSEDRDIAAALFAH